MANIDREVYAMNTNNSESLRYKTVKDLANIIQLFEDRGGEEQSVMDIARSLKMLPSKASRLLKSLEAEEFFEKSITTGKYSLGIRFLQPGLLYVFNHPLRRIILPHLEHMVHELNLPAGWAIFRNNRIIVIDRFPSGKRSIVSRVGSNVPVHSSSYGKLFLSYLSANEQKRLINSITYVKYTPATITDAKRMRDEISQTRQRGYAVDLGETAPDISSIAAPLFSERNGLAAALSVSIYKAKPDQAFLKKTVAYLTDRARFISRQLGYRGHLEL